MTQEKDNPSHDDNTKICDDTVICGCNARNYNMGVADVILLLEKSMVEPKFHADILINQTLKSAIENIKDNLLNKKL